LFPSSACLAYGPVDHKVCASPNTSSTPSKPTRFLWHANFCASRTGHCAPRGNLGKPVSWPVQYLRATPSDAHARVLVNLDKARTPRALRGFTVLSYLCLSCLRPSLTRASIFRAVKGRLHSTARDSASVSK